jgi:hypothetical protein
MLNLTRKEDIISEISLINQERVDYKKFYNSVKRILRIEWIDSVNEVEKYIS